MRNALIQHAVSLAALLLIAAATPVSGQSGVRPSGRDLGDVTVTVLPAVSPTDMPGVVALRPPSEPDRPIAPRREPTPQEEPSPPPAPPAPEPPDGDCDRSGSLSVADAQCALDMSAGLRSADLAADLDGDGAITSADARTILQQALRPSRTDSR